LSGLALERVFHLLRGDQLRPDQKMPKLHANCDGVLLEVLDTRSLLPDSATQYYRPKPASIRVAGLQLCGDALPPAPCARRIGNHSPA
jgi:hypothetical protein